MKRQSIFSDYFELCKPRVVLLMLLTSTVGMCLATSEAVSFHVLFWGNIGIGLVASAAAVLNHAADQHIDRLMRRTELRPVAQGRITIQKSLIFSTILCISGMSILFFGLII